MKMAGLLENIRVLEAEIKEEEERTRHISDILPQINQLKQEAQALSSTSRDIESQLTEIENLKTDTKAELTQVAKAAYASASGFLSTKVFLFSAISGCMGGGVLGFVILTIAMAFGKVRNLKELTFHPELTTLGVIPLKYEGIATNQEEKLVADGIYYKFQTADIKKKLLFACCLPGAESNKFLQETLDWNYIMSGQKMIWLRLVSAMNYEDVEEAEHYSLVVANQNVGDIPVENTFALSPSEQLLLTRDIDDLRKAGYDLIIIDGVEPLKRSGVLFNQMDNVQNLLMNN